MARKDQGNTLLTLKAQTRPRFVTQRSGFDTGTRTFVCDTTRADALEPKLHTPDSVHKQMFIESVERVDMENGVTEFSVQYLGLKNGSRTKMPHIEESAQSQFLSEVPSGAVVQPVTFVRPVPTVTVTYIGNRKPSIMEVGSEMRPPGYSRLMRPKGYYTAFLADQRVIFEGWILKDRSNRPAGNTLFETVDVFTYEVITLPAE